MTNKMNSQMAGAKRSALMAYAAGLTGAFALLSFTIAQNTATTNNKPNRAVETSCSNCDTCGEYATETIDSTKEDVNAMQKAEPNVGKAITKHSSQNHVLGHVKEGNLECYIEVLGTIPARQPEKNENDDEEFYLHMWIYCT